MTSNHWKGNVMSSISPLMARIFDDPHPVIADVKTTRNEAVWNQRDGCLGLSEADPEPIPLDIARNSIRSYGAHSFAQ